MILYKEISLLLEEYKAEDIVSLDVKNKSSVTDTMIIASGRSTRHVKSISDNIIKKLKKAKVKPIGIEGYSKSEWEKYSKLSNRLLLEYFPSSNFIKTWKNITFN